LLGALRGNGGPNRTRALLRGSPGLDSNSMISFDRSE
jgi:hypothetical protein